MFEVIGNLSEILLDSGQIAGRIVCPPCLIPAPGQYLLAHDINDANVPLPVPVYLASPHPDGFTTAAPIPSAWTPGTQLHLRGPLGKGFTLPKSAQQVALVALGGTTSRLLALLTPTFVQGAVVTLLCDNPLSDLPLDVEIRPLSELPEIRAWADYLALDLPRENLSSLRTQLGLMPEEFAPKNAQALIESPVPCGGIGECGICSAKTRRGWKLTCKDGPVFDLEELI